MAKKANQNKPNMAPQETKSASASSAAPTPDDLISSGASAQESASTQLIEDMPMQTPPNEVVETEMAYGASVWHNNKKITSMYSTEHNKNCYAYVQGLGWKKISTKNSSISQQLNAVLSHAYAANRNTKVKIDNNMIIEAYVW